MSSGPAYGGSFPPAPSGPPAPEPPLPSGEPEPSDVIEWRRPALLFALSVVSIFLAGAMYVAPPGATLAQCVTRIYTGWTFAVPMLAILLAHEFGHYIAARLHRVPASLPYFLPLPLLSPFGTLGAVIAMRGRIRSRDALLDIGASGPLAGMVVAIPVLAIGLLTSKVGPAPLQNYTQEGQSLLYWALKRLVLGPMPAGYDVNLSATAFAGWAGLLITMMNLIPWGQLDGGHIAFSLFGPWQNRAARWFRSSLLVLFAMNLLAFAIPISQGRLQMSYGMAFLNSWAWLIWWMLLGLLGRVSGGSDHPPFEPGPLSPVRKVVAAVSLVLFALLFMPRPWTNY